MPRSRCCYADPSRKPGECPRALEPCPGGADRDRVIGTGGSADGVLGRTLGRAPTVWHAAPMPFAPLPEAASWQHHGLRSGFEVAYFHEDDGASNVEGWTTAVEEGRPWVVSYEISLDGSWRTR